MNLIYKQTLKPDYNITQTLKLPAGSKILSVQSQLDNITIWYMFHTAFKNELIHRKFILIPTGYEFELPCNRMFLGTVQTYDGHSVSHVFELL